jgi:cell division protein FtsI (penicillin-binding protein 3)/stage V sporulation protein D (sporulation-specific penicillin-binding protein)
MSKGFASNYRIVLIAIGVFAAFGGIGTRLVFLHVIDRAKLVQYVEKARREIIVENARRGDILDSHGDVLATSRSLIVLGVDPQMLRKEDEAKWPELARLAGVSLDDLTKIFNTKYRAAKSEEKPEDAKPELKVTADEKDADEDSEESREIRWAKISETVTESAYDRINALNVKGVYGTRSYRRTYPHNQLAAHIIGYVNEEKVPAAGIERYADFYLRGQNGWRESEKDGHQRELAQFSSRDVPATDGYTVTISIDSVVQHMIEQELDLIAKQFTPQKATIIVSDARTGFILGLANYPSFNLNDFSKAPLDVQRNFAITDQYDPGSVFKIVALSGALNENLVTLQTRFDCSSDYADYRGRHLRLEPDEHHWDHQLTVAEIIAHSSNRGAARLAMLMGEEKFYEYAKRFGFGDETGFPFGGEISGELHPPSKWSGIDITRIPTGYSVSTTPMQVHYGMAVIASGGELLRPEIIREVRDASGQLVYRFAPDVKRRVISAQTATEMQEALQGVASKEGTAAVAAIPGYQVAGKTGTAEKLINHHYSKTNHVGSFVGFFPATRPRVVISVIVDDGHPKNGLDGYGATVAAPSFRHVAEQLIQYLDIAPVDPVADQKKPMFAFDGGHP